MKIELLELDEIWPQADYITVHVPLIPQTENLINTEVLGRCKKGVKIINVARGGIVSEQDLLKGLEAGHVGGAALDVFVDVSLLPSGSEYQLCLGANKELCPGGPSPLHLYSPPGCLDYRRPAARGHRSSREHRLLQ